MRRSSLLVALAGFASLAGDARSEGMANITTPPSALRKDLMSRSGAQSSTGSPSHAPFVPVATCCEPIALGVYRNDRPLVKWVLSEEPIGEIRAANAPVSPVTIAPAPRTPAPAVAIVAAAATVPMDIDIEEVLAQWSDTSHALEPMSPARTQRLTRSLQQDYSGHEIAWITLFTGPIEREDLRDLLNWTGMRSTPDGVTLTAVPRDATERLFVSRLEVTLTENHVPKSITFVDREGNRRAESVAFEQIRIQPGRTLASQVVQVAALKIPGDGADIRTAEFVGDPAVNPVALAISSDDPTSEMEERDLETGDEVIRKWAAATAHAPVREIEFREFQYDLVRRRESRREGRALVSRDGSIQSLPMGTPDEDAARPEILLPMARAFSVDEFRRQYVLKIANSDERGIRLQLTPRRDADRKALKLIEVMLSRETMLPVAIRSVSRTRETETVWSIHRTVARQAADAP